MANHRATNRRQLEERITYLQLTLAMLTEQLEAQDRLHSLAEGDDGVHAADKRYATAQSSYTETPLPIAAG